MPAPDDLTILRKKPFSQGVEKFEDLFVQSRRAFLIGAGCSKCAGLPLTAELTDMTLQSTELEETSKSILTSVKKLFDGAPNAHIEDYLSELVDLLAIAKRRTEREAAQTQVPLDGKQYSAAQLKTAAEQIKIAIAKIINEQVNIETHQAFVSAVHRPIRVGKVAPTLLVDYLVLNYDTVIEDALALECVPFSDGIDGGVTGWWNPQTFNRDGLAARVLKLHGSINWCEVPGNSLPRRIASTLRMPATQDRRILIWPASTKYRETQLDPFAQLAEQARCVMRPTQGSQLVLVICGYSFADSHINIEIDRALRESSGNLTVVAFVSEDKPTGQLKTWAEDENIREQVLVFANRGFFHGDVVERSERDLLWWKFENITRLLGGER
ncbi:SIR2 family protein [Candidatus Nitrospira salsa]